MSEYTRMADAFRATAVEMGSKVAQDIAAQMLIANVLLGGLKALEAIATELRRANDLAEKGNAPSLGHPQVKGGAL